MSWTRPRNCGWKPSTYDNSLPVQVCRCRLVVGFRERLQEVPCGHSLQTGSMEPPGRSQSPSCLLQVIGLPSTGLWLSKNVLAVVQEKEWSKCSVPVPPRDLHCSSQYRVRGCWCDSAGPFCSSLLFQVSNGCCPAMRNSSPSGFLMFSMLRGFNFRGPLCKCCWCVYVCQPSPPSRR